jgi:hypothetical protein
MATNDARARKVPFSRNLERCFVLLLRWLKGAVRPLADTPMGTSTGTLPAQHCHRPCVFAGTRAFGVLAAGLR